ncbi:helix-turn-helix domain-containing protein [Streptomyces sp. NPDC093260]
MRPRRGRQEQAQGGRCRAPQAGESVSAIAKALGISRATLYRHLGEGA